MATSSCQDWYLGVIISRRSGTWYVPPIKSRTAGQLKTAGCLRCCSLAKELSQVNCNDILLDGQLSFTPDLANKNRSGRFLLHRLHNHLIEHLPTGEINSRGCTNSLIKRLLLKPYTAQLLNEKLRQEHQEGKSRWVEPGELAAWQKSSGLSPYFLSPVLVVNLKSMSSLVRLCINPAVSHPMLARPDLPDSVKRCLMYNDTVFTYSGDLITPEKFAMYQTCSVMICVVDSKAAFRQIALDQDAQFHSIVFRLKDKHGNCSLTEAECHSPKLHMLLETVVSFWQSDLPALLGACVKQSAMRYHNLASKE